MEEIFFWDEAAIRREFAALDAKTGLNGALLPISFGNARYTLGEYNPADGGSFRFSEFYFRNPDWPAEAAVDVIRHEYAHHMNHVLYGNHGHDATWRRCCVAVCARPIRCYSEYISQLYQKEHTAEAALSAHYDVYRPGSRIVHPQYGVGVIREVTGESTVRCVSVEFPAGRKLLTLDWVDKYCSRQPRAEEVGTALQQEERKGSR